MKSLVVDDDPYIRKMIQEVLELEGYVAATAQNGKEALEYLRANLEAHVVVMGGVLPIMNGQHAIEEALQDNQLADRLIFIPCSSYERYLTWAAKRLQLPKVAVIQKPVTVEQILAAVSWAVTRLNIRQSNLHA